MKFSAWLTYPNLSLSVQKLEGIYRCRRYVGSTTRPSQYRDCGGPLELKYYLLSFENAPKKEIITLITELEKLHKPKNQPKDHT